jgi:hypothetical protein
VAFGRDQRIDPFDVSLRGLGAVLEQGPRVAIAAARCRRASGARQAVGQGGASAGEELEAGVRVEVAAERELQREGALVVAARVVVEQQL